MERLWPRGIRKDGLKMKAWLKEVAPSPALRTWYAHDVEKWVEFQRRYRAELASQPQAWQPLVEAAQGGIVTLLYSARDMEHNSALVLKAFIEERLKRG